MLNTLITGNTRDDPTALTVAIVTVLGKGNLTETSGRREIESSDLHKAIGVSHVSMRSPRREYELLDAPWTDQWSTPRTRAFPAADIAILVSNPTEGPTPETGSYLHLLHALASTPHLLLFLNQPEDQVPDADLAAVTELELEELCAGAGFPGPRVFIGSAAASARCPCPDGTCETCRPVRDLVDAMDTVPMPTRAVDQPARMLIEHVYERVTVGKVRIAKPVPFGLLAAGELRVGDTIEAVGGGSGPVTAKVESLQAFGASRERVPAGEIVSALLADVSRKEIHPPRILCQPGTARTASELIVRLDFGDLPGLLATRLELIASAGAVDIASLSPLGEGRVAINLALPISIHPGDGIGLAGPIGLMGSGRIETAS